MNRIAARSLGEQAGPDVLDVLVQGVALAEPSLEGHELPARVLLEGGEEQPGVQSAIR
jgi:hypothetical protein